MTKCIFYHSAGDATLKDTSKIKAHQTISKHNKHNVCMLRSMHLVPIVLLILLLTLYILLGRDSI